MADQPSISKRLIKTFQVNNNQLAFGSYAAELSFYVIWALVPLMLALSNIIAVLPFSEAEIIQTIKMALPDEVEVTVIPLLETYLTGTSAGLFSLSLIISLWPASNVFNTLQRVLNTIYKTEPRKNFFISRLFAYVFTLVLVIVLVIFTFALVFGEIIINYIQDVFHIQLQLLDFFVNQGWLLGILGIFILLVGIYYYMPNVQWNLIYAIPGSVFTLLGFILVSQLFNVYMSIAGGNVGSGTIGVFIVAIIWLYLNAMVIAIGAYINVFFHDFKEKSYWRLVEETKTYKSFTSYSDNYSRYDSSHNRFNNIIYRDVSQSVKEKGEMNDIH
ncbi:YihY/virulence factor BrkB family protein [Aerococcaceae bacterium WGS1372]